MLSVAPLLAFSRGAGAQHPLTTLPLDDPAYVQLAAMQRAGCTAARVSAFRPYFVRDIRSALIAATTDPNCAPLVVDALQRRFGVSPLPSVIAISLDSAALVPAVQVAPAASPTPVVHKDSVPQGLSWGGEATLALTGMQNEFLPLWRDVRPDSEGDPIVRGIGRFRLRWSGGPKFLAVAEVYGESNRRNDPTVRAKTLRQSEALLDVGESYLNGQLGPVILSLGRANEAWLGSGRESLVLSAYGPAVDRVLLYGRWSKVQFRALVGQLDDVVLTEGQDSLAAGTGNVRLQRAFFGHALTWTPIPSIELNVGETLLSARRGNTLDLAYANPLVPLVIAQNDTGRTFSAGRDNLMLFGSARVQVGPAQLQGDLLVDDVQVDQAEQGTTQNQLGYALAASYAMPTSQPTIAQVAYRRMGSFTFMRPFFSETYQFYGAPLGSELGPDADRLDVSLEHLPNGLLQVSAGVSLWRHGATRIERRPSESPIRGGDVGFPSTRPGRPVVQRAVVWSLAARLLSGTFPVTASFQAASISNLNNQPSAAALYLRTVLSGTYALHYP